MSDEHSDPFDQGAMSFATPGEIAEFVFDGHIMEVMATSDRGIQSGRRRYRVECLTCKKVLSLGSTGPQWTMKQHAHSAHKVAPQWRPYEPCKEQP